MSFQQRIEAIIKRKREEELVTDFISDTNQQQPIKNCTDKLFKLILKLEESKAKSKKQFPVKVRERIFIGNYVFASDVDFLRESNIGLIISCLSTSPVKSFEHIRYEKISIKDQEGEDVLQFAENVFKMMEDHLKNDATNIYIHCFHGRSRSPTILLMYLMRKESKSIKQLLNDLKKVYPLAQPYQCFMEQLNQFQGSISNIMNCEQNEKTQVNQHDDLLGFDLQPVSSLNAMPEQEDHFGILQNVPTTASLLDHRQHLLIPQYEKSHSPKKNTQYHLIQIDQDDQNANLI